jgi:hypothetical protein
MTDTTEPPETDQERKFAQQAEQRSPGIVAEFWDFLIHNKKWWITPIVVILLLMGALILLNSTPLAPFIYTLY